MKSRDFVYWLQGFFEIADPKEITAKQADVIKSHLSMVFIHEIDPSMGDQEHQDALTAAHLTDVLRDTAEDTKRRRVQDAEFARMYPPRCYL